MFDTRISPAVNRGVGIAFTDRFGGQGGQHDELNLGSSSAAEQETLRANLTAVQVELGLTQLVTVNQVHATTVLVVDEAFLTHWRSDSWLGERGPTGVALPVADALVSTQPEVGLCIRVADCMPVLFADPEAKVIGAAHAGRRGLLAGVLTSTVQELRRLGAQQISAWLGPHICGSCYEVPQELYDCATAERPELRSRTTWGTPALDLAAGAAAELAALGIALRRCDRCTRTSDNLFSYRVDGPGGGRQAGIVWLDSPARCRTRRSTPCNLQ